jgi:hypothetical protein
LVIAGKYVWINDRALRPSRLRRIGRKTTTTHILDTNSENRLLSTQAETATGSKARWIPRPQQMGWMRQNHHTEASAKWNVATLGMLTEK